MPAAPLIEEKSIPSKPLIPAAPSDEKSKSIPLVEAFVEAGGGAGTDAVAVVVEVEVEVDGFAAAVGVEVLSPVIEEKSNPVRLTSCPPVADAPRLAPVEVKVSPAGAVAALVPSRAARVSASIPVVVVPLPPADDCDVKNAFGSNGGMLSDESNALRSSAGGPLEVEGATLVEDASPVLVGRANGTGSVVTGSGAGGGDGDRVRSICIDSVAGGADDVDEGSTGIEASCAIA